jgi:hypothetical protein
MNSEYQPDSRLSTELNRLVGGSATSVTWDGVQEQVQRKRARRRLGVRLVAAGVGVIALAGAISGFLLFNGGDGGMTSVTPAFAAEAVKKAAADTAAAAGSGIIATTLMQGDAIVLSRTFSWKDEDLAVKTGGLGQGDSEYRYVDGRFYAKDYFDPYDGEWHHYVDYDNGGGGDPAPDGAYTGFVPAQLLSDSRSALLGSGLMDMVGSASGLTQNPTAEGGRSFTGSVTATKLLTYFAGLAGTPYASQPLLKLKAADSKTPVSIVVVVDRKGLIQTATLGYEVQGTSFTYKVTYSDLGNAAAISAPDPARTTTIEGSGMTSAVAG